MIVTFTANPSLDRTATIEVPLTRGGVHRISTITTEPGGKGVNVARAIHLAGQDALAIVPSDPHDPLLSGLEALGVPFRNVPTGSPVRSNLTVTEPDGTTSKLNEPGAALDAGVVDLLTDLVVDSARTSSWVALSGSLPPGAPVDWYARMVKALRPLGVKVAIDTSDAPLQALAANFPEAAPDLIKPNSEELGQLSGQDGLALEAAAAAGDWHPVLSAAHELTARGVGAVLVTLGGSGALLVTSEGAWLATPPPITLASTVGAGDSALAGYLLADIENLGSPDKLRRAVAYGSGAAALAGSALPAPDQTNPDAVVVTAVATTPSEGN
ncbi:MAG TPA: 1-phosphofructokinase family hexose kinase [Propionibacteriaceae bacterium]|nr:1-phosphofructokinase family hexose kinase [Propionibacteriaceae bacterium]